MHTRFLVASMVLCLLGSACHVDAKVNASTGDQEPPSDRSDDDTTTAEAPAASAAPAAAAPTTPPTDACPLACFEARGSERVNLTAEETEQLRSSLEPVLGRMRTCTSPDEWRRRGSPVINLRVAPDGTLSELGVDPHHGDGAPCFDDAGRSSGNVSLSLPGRKVVRCAERCARPAAAPRGRGRGRGRRAR